MSVEDDAQIASALRDLIAKLEYACSLTDPRAAETISLEWTLNFLADALADVGADYRLLYPLIDLSLRMGEDLAGPAFKGFEKTNKLAQACAFVTVLHQCHGYRVKEAIKEVSDTVGLEAPQLQTYRDNIHRGHHAYGGACYRSFIEKLQNLSLAELKAEIEIC